MWRWCVEDTAQCCYTSLSQVHSHQGSLWTWGGAHTPAIHVHGPFCALGTLQLHLTPCQQNPACASATSHPPLCPGCHRKENWVQRPDGKNVLQHVTSLHDKGSTPTCCVWPYHLHWVFSTRYSSRLALFQFLSFQILDCTYVVIYAQSQRSQCPPADPSPGSVFLPFTFRAITAQIAPCVLTGRVYLHANMDHDQLRPNQHSLWCLFLFSDHLI